MDQGKNMEEKVFSYIEQYRMIEAGDQVIVGVSGGADSVCLLFLLWEYQKKVPFSVQAVHVNHQLRGSEAKRDEEYVVRLCRELSIPCSVYSYEVERIAGKRHMTVEEAGRAVRQQAFSLEGKKAGAKSTALAHHRDDLAETVLHNLARGSGAAGLAGIHPVRRMGDGVYIRPLLCVGRSEIESWLLKKHIAWMEDSTNKELSYTRNKIRERVLPELKEVNPRAVEHIAKAAQTFLSVEEYLGQQADMLYSRYVRGHEDGLFLSEEISAEHPVMQAYVVKRVLAYLAGGEKDITSVHVEEALELLGQRTGRQKSLAHGITVQQSYGNLLFYKKGDREILPKELEFHVFSWENQQIPEKKYTKWFDYDKIKGNLTVRKRQPGDYLTVTSTGGRKKLKDYLIDCKIPRQERENLTLLADGSHIVWVVGYRISEYYKITGQTKTVIKVQVKGEKEDE